MLPYLIDDRDDYMRLYFGLSATTTHRSLRDKLSLRLDGEVCVELCSETLRVERGLVEGLGALITVGSTVGLSTSKVKPNSSP